MADEIIWDTRGTRARTSQTKDSVIYTFRNGSTLENIAANENSRGKRFQSGLTLAHYKLFELLENLKRQLAAKLPIGRKFNDYPEKEYTISDW